MLTKIIKPAIIFLLFTSCVKQVSLNLRTPAPQLVVEGLLLTDSTPCQVTLSYSGIFNSQGGQTLNGINDATVYVNDSIGSSTQLINVGGGVYMSPSYVTATVGGSYWLSITLSNGKKYLSFPETIAPVPKNLALDTILESSPNNPLLANLYAGDVRIKTQDPGNQRNYYRWTNTDYIAREATGVPCSLGSSTPCYQFCTQYYPNDTAIRILSDANFNGQEIREQNAVYIPYFSVGKNYVLIKQLSLTAQSYEFWQLYQQQTARTGSILDPLPASLEGNIYNPTDSTDIALGNFEASDATSLKLILAPIFVNGYFTFDPARPFIAQGACYLVFPNASNYAPQGWENAQQIIYDVY